jgi:hypothetical protein
MSDEDSDSVFEGVGQAVADGAARASDSPPPSPQESESPKDDGALGGVGQAIADGAAKAAE